LGALGVEVRCLAHGAAGPLERDGIAWEPVPLGAAVPAGAVAVLDGAATAHGRKVVRFHDGGSLAPGAALVIAPIAARVEAGGAEWLGGLEHACLRAMFWDLPPARVRPQVRRVLVTTGAGADGDALAESLAGALPAALPGAEIGVVRGPFSALRAPEGVALLDAPASLRTPLLDADLVVATAGQTSLEAAACGTPAVLVALDQPQAEQAERLAAAGAAVVARPEDAAAAAVALASDAAARGRMAAAGQAAVDGCGALRVAERIGALSP